MTLVFSSCEERIKTNFMEKSGFGNRVFIFTNLMYVYLEVIRTGCVGWCDFPFKNPLSVILIFEKFHKVGHFYARNRILTTNPKTKDE